MVRAKIPALMFITLIVLMIVQTTHAQILWQHCYGGADEDGSTGVRTLDGGYILAGNTASHNGDADSNHADVGRNAWAVKITATGAVEWENCYGGNTNECLYMIMQNADSSYATAGYCNSMDSGIVGGHGGMDMWLLKLDPSGSLTAQLCLGGCGNEIATSMTRTADGGLIVVGTCDTNCGEVSGYHYGFFGAGRSMDIWVVKLSATDSIEWAKSFGGTNDEYPGNIIPTLDGGYIFCGLSFSDNGDITGHIGDTNTTNIWIVKLSDTGAIQWQQSILGGIFELGYGCVLQNTDSSYMYAGTIPVGAAESKGYIIKLSPGGTTLWDTLLSYWGYDGYSAISPTNDGGYICTGWTGATTLPLTHDNVWVTKIAASGTVDWSQAYGGSSLDYGCNAVQNTDSSFTVFGTVSSNDGDVSGNHGGDDGWVFKLGSATSVKNVQAAGGVSIYPNPAGDAMSISAGFMLGVVTLTNVVGQVVASDTYYTNTATIDIADLQPGIYLVSINSRVTARFVKK